MGKRQQLLPQESPVRGELVTIDEASKRIHLGKTSLYYCIRTGKLRYFQPTMGKILLDTADLDDWLRNSVVPAGAMPGNIQEVPMGT